MRTEWFGRISEEKKYNYGIGQFVRVQKNESLCVGEHWEFSI